MIAVILRYSAPAIKIPVEQIVSIDAGKGILKVQLTSNYISGYHIKIEKGRQPL